MTEVLEGVSLTPKICFSFQDLRDFLRSSRAAIDDNISQNLNRLATPPKAGAETVSIAQRLPARSSRRINPGSCGKFQNQLLFPIWQARTDVLDYCAIVAARPDPDDPDKALRTIEIQKERERTVDERLDPYSARSFPRETRAQSLANLIHQERAIEDIVRHRTWTVIQDRCETSASTWQEAMRGYESNIRIAVRFSK